MSQVFPKNQSSDYLFADVRNLCYISDTFNCSRPMESITHQIENAIESLRRGAFIFPADFASFGTPEAVTKSLQRLKSSGMLIRIAHGIYYYPKIDKQYGLGIIPPTTEETAYAIAKRDKARICPTGTFALNALGISAQVPGNVVFITDGAPRKVNVGKGKGILFKHSDESRNFAYESKEMQLVVAALRELGKDGVNEDVLGKIRTVVTSVSETQFKNDIALSPAWIRKVLLSI